jgi:hypothetical protein
MSQAFLILAALLVAFIGALHSYLGERLILGRLLALAELPLLRSGRTYTQAILRWAWHLTSLAWWTLAVLLLMLAFSWTSSATIGAVLAASLVLNGVLILAAVGTRHPAWLLFLLSGVLTWIATR